MGPPSGTLGEELLLGLRGVVRLRCFFGFTLSELPAFGFQEVLGMPLAVFGLPVVTTELPFDDDLLAFLNKRREVLSGLSPHGHVYESSDLLAFAFVIVKELVVRDRRSGNRSACVGFSQGWVSNQVTSDDDVIDVHSNMRVFLVV